MEITIKNRWTGKPITTLNAHDLRMAVIHLIACDANLREVDLRGADLRGADLSGANLGGITIPVVPNPDTAILARLDAGEYKIEMSCWHTCRTTHCRAGHIIDLAGEAGYALEDKIGSCAAGALIYQASAGYVPNFYASNSEALDDIRAHAAQEPGKN